MKIVQNPENGQIGIQLDQDEVYDVEEHLSVLMNFTVEQAVTVFTIKSSFNKILERLEQLENKINQATKED